MSKRNMNQCTPRMCFFPPSSIKPTIRLVTDGLLITLVALMLLISVPPQPAKAQTSEVPLILGWSSTESEHTESVARGDYDGDGERDLAVGNDDQPNRLYRNDDGVLTTSAAWSSAEADYTRSLA